MAASKPALDLSQRRLLPWGYSLLLHVGIVACLLMNFHWGTAVVPSLGGTSETEPVKATVVDQKLIDQQMTMLKSEQEKKHQEKQQLEQNLTDLKQQQSAAQQQVNQQMADLKARSDHLAKLKEEDERLSQQKTTADNNQRRRQLQDEIAGEEKSRNAGLASALQKWMALIQLKIHNNWIPPASTPSNLSCIVVVSQVTGGTVTGAQVPSCNGDDAVVQSIITAVYRSSPLPAPPDPSLFEQGKSLRLTFNNKNQNP
jgi:colicin import membrane protein